MARFVGSTVAISVMIPGRKTPQIVDVPWYPGLTVLQAMIVGQAMVGPSAFSFRTVYHSTYGAYVDVIDDAVESGGKYWVLRIGGPQSPPASFGPAEQILDEPPEDSVTQIIWSLETPPPMVSASQLSRRLTAART